MEQFLAALIATWSVALLVAGVAIIVGKFWPPGMTAYSWTWLWLGGGSVAAVMGAVIWTAVKGHSRLEAAYEIDRRFGLKERVATACSLTPDELATQAGQAVLDDAQRQILRVHVAERFAVAPGRRILWPVAAGILAVLSAVLIKESVTEATANAAPVGRGRPGEGLAQTLENAWPKTRRSAGQRIGRSRRSVDENRTRHGATGRHRKGRSEEGLARIERLVQGSAKRRDQLMAGDKLKNQLNQLKGMDGGPADKFAQAMKNGDFNKAADELQALQDKMAKGQLDPEEREKLADQLDRMQQSMQKAADAHEQARQDLKQEIDKQRQAATQGSRAIARAVGPGGATVAASPANAKNGSKAVRGRQMP